MYRYLYLVLLCLDAAIAQTGVSSIREDTTLANQYLARAEKLSQTAERDSVNFYLEKALASRRRVFGENHLEVGRAYFKMGKYGFAGDLDKKLEYVYKALAILLPLLGENHVEVGACYGRAGSLQNAKGNFDTAIELILKALTIRLEQLGKAHPDVGHTYNELGAAYARKKDYKNAIENFAVAGEVFRQTFGEDNQFVARSYVNLSLVYGTNKQNEQYDKALEYGFKALDLLKRLFGDNAVGTSYRNIGYYYMGKGDYNQAITYLQNSINVFRRAGQGRTMAIASSYQILGDVYSRLNEIEKALDFYQKSLIAVVPDFADSNIYVNPPLSSLNDDANVLELLSSKPRALMQLYRTTTHAARDMQMALSTYELAAGLIDKIRSSYRDEEARLLLGENFAKIYHEAIAAALEGYKVKPDVVYQTQAFTFAEKNKAAVLAQSLQESRARSFAGIPPALLEKEKSLRRELAFGETTLQQINQRDAKTRELEDRYFAVRRDYEALIDQFEKAYPKYFDLKYRTQTVAVAELQKALDHQTAVIEYFVGDSTIFSFVVTQRQFKVTAQPKDSTFSKIVAELASSFKNVTSKPAYLRGATQLYHTLISPLEPAIAAKPKWVIIPDGELYQVPFEALLKAPAIPQDAADYRELNYLLRQHRISYHFSATLFLQSQQQTAGNATKIFAGFAPVFDTDAKNGHIYRSDLEDSSAISLIPKADSTFLATRDGKTLDPLPYSAQEVQDILVAFPGRSRAFMKQEASEENFKQQIKGYKYVHVATHGRIVQTNPKLSNLTFSQPQAPNAKEDGILFSSETYNLDLNADLLVLSACQTGTGKLVKSEGLMALTRGFFYSGARNIIASLWKVYDQHTSLLIVEMYRQIAAGKSYSAALREAKLKMLTNPETAAPQSWAGFVLIGK